MWAGSSSLLHCEALILRLWPKTTSRQIAVRYTRISKISIVWQLLRLAWPFKESLPTPCSDPVFLEKPVLFGFSALGATSAEWNLRMSRFVLMIAHRPAVEASLRRSDLFSSCRTHKYLLDLLQFWYHRISLPRASGKEEYSTVGFPSSLVQLFWKAACSFRSPVSS